MSNETLHFVSITEDEKKLLNLYRKFLEHKDLLTDIEDNKAIVIKEMVRHSVEDWAMEETMNARGSDLCKSPYEVFLNCIEFMYSDNEESQKVLGTIRSDWEEKIENAISGDLEDLSADEQE